jgi:hypothetical protein
MKIISLPFVLLMFVISVTSCTSPRNIISSGKVTPKGAFKAGFNTSFNAATAPLAEIDDITKAAVDAIDNNKDSIYYTPDNPGEKGMHGSIGIQYSGQKSDLPSKVGLDKLSSIFNYELSRKDILIPLAFSYSFGPEETYGNISFGVVYGHSSIKYGFNPSKVLVRYAGNNLERIPSFSHKQSYSSFGAFINAKLGYKYAYFLPALSIYHQNYGTYNLFGQQESYKGFTFIPSIGLQLNFGYGKSR